jgi:hypothetical protein
MRTAILLFLSVFISGILFGQDSVRKREVSVTSTFKPVLKEAAKINFNATPPTADTSRPRLQYNIPNQGLVLGYLPGTLKPMALTVDTGGNWDNWNYAKVGYGSLNTPYFETGLSLGNGNTAGLNIYGKHISSKGKIEHQDYSNTAVELNGFLKAGKNIELFGRVIGKENKYNKYGYEPKPMELPEDSLKINFQSFSTRVGFRNIDRGQYGLSYAPELQVDVFNDRLNNRETNAYFNLPLRKTLGGHFEADVAFEGNVNRYSPKGKNNIKSNYFSIAPSLLVKSENIFLQAGIRPSWDNSEFKLLPNVLVEANSTDKSITIMGGWIGYLRSNSYQSFANFNPYIWAPEFVNNSRIQEIYGGIKGALTDHFSYSAKLGYNTITNQPLYRNDTMTGRNFEVLNKDKIKAFNFTGEIGYNVGEQFSLRSALKLNRYMDLDEFGKAWGLLPMEFTTSLRLQVLKDLYVKSDFLAFGGAPYQTKADEGKTKGAMDVSAGLEFQVVKNVKLWAQFNNILNREYERWKQYPVYGFNFLGGVVFSFAKQNK